MHSMLDDKSISARAYANIVDWDLDQLLDSLNECSGCRRQIGILPYSCDIHLPSRHCLVDHLTSPQPPPPSRMLMLLRRNPIRAFRDDCNASHPDADTKKNRVGNMDMNVDGNKSLLRVCHSEG